MSEELTYKDIPEYASLSQEDRDAIDALIGGARIPVDDATFERIVLGNEPDWRALAQEAGQAVRWAQWVSSHCSMCEDPTYPDCMQECDRVVPMYKDVLDKLKAAGLEV